MGTHCNYAYLVRTKKHQHSRDERKTCQTSSSNVQTKWLQSSHKSTCEIAKKVLTREAKSKVFDAGKSWRIFAILMQFSACFRSLVCALCKFFSMQNSEASVSAPLPVPKSTHNRSEEAIVMNKSQDDRRFWLIVQKKRSPSAKSDLDAERVNN